MIFNTGANMHIVPEMEKYVNIFAHKSINMSGQFAMITSVSQQQAKVQYQTQLNLEIPNCLLLKKKSKL
jgi:hypothetical protein